MGLVEQEDIDKYKRALERVRSHLEMAEASLEIKDAKEGRECLQQAICSLVLAPLFSSKKVREQAKQLLDQNKPEEAHQVLIHEHPSYWPDPFYIEEESHHLRPLPESSEYLLEADWPKAWRRLTEEESDLAELWTILEQAEALVASHWASPVNRPDHALICQVGEEVSVREFE